MKKKQINKEELVKQYKIKLLTKMLENSSGKKVSFKQLKENDHEEFKIKDNRGGAYKSQEDHNFWNTPLNDEENDFFLDDEDDYFTDFEDDETEEEFVKKPWHGRIKRESVEKNTNKKLKESPKKPTNSIKKQKVKILVKKIEEASKKKVSFIKEEAPKKPQQIYQQGYESGGKTVTTDAIENIVNSKFGMVNDYANYNFDSFQEKVLDSLSQAGYNLSVDDLTMDKISSEILHYYSYGKIEEVVDNLHQYYPPEELENFDDAETFLEVVKLELENEGVDIDTWPEVNSNLNVEKTIEDYYNENIDNDFEEEF